MMSVMGFEACGSNFQCRLKKKITDPVKPMIMLESVVMTAIIRHDECLFEGQMTVETHHVETRLLSPRIENYILYVTSFLFIYFGTFI